MTRRIPWRLMILQLLQILLTEDFTFTVLLLMLPSLSLWRRGKNRTLSHLFLKVMRPRVKS
jgi:hypothetical protein